MDIVLTIMASLCLMGGLAGALMPVLPGPPLSWLGMLLFHFTKYADFSNTFLVVSALFMVLITLIDIYLPFWSTKIWGGSKSGMNGSIVGFVIGSLLFPPFGIFIGTFLGALLGEILFNGSDYPTALKSALGSFIGFLAGTFIKLIYSLMMIYYFIRALL